MELTVRNKANTRIFSLGTFIFRGTQVDLFYCTYINWSFFFYQLINNKIWFPFVPMDITARKKVPTRIFSLETYFLHFIQGDIGEPILLHVSLLGAFFLATNPQ
jgi:hypothetical protein